MFTGIVEEVGKVASIRKGAHSCVLTVAASKVLEDVHLGDSIATNGVCLTVTGFTRSGFSADVMHETLNRSSLGALRPGSPVNLERAMLAGGRFGGHIVSGHIDGVGTVKSIDEDDNAVWYRIGCDASILRFIVEKGSIAIKGAASASLLRKSTPRASAFPSFRTHGADQFGYQARGRCGES